MSKKSKAAQATRPPLTVNSYTIQAACRILLNGGVDPASFGGDQYRLVDMARQAARGLGKEIAS